MRSKAWQQLLIFAEGLQLQLWHTKFRFVQHLFKVSTRIRAPRNIVVVDILLGIFSSMSRSGISSIYGVCHPVLNIFRWHKFSFHWYYNEGTVASRSFLEFICPCLRISSCISSYIFKPFSHFSSVFQFVLSRQFLRLFSFLLPFVVLSSSTIPASVAISWCWFS
jgi:hypothetical protein